MSASSQRGGALSRSVLVAAAVCSLTFACCEFCSIGVPDTYILSLRDVPYEPGVTPDAECGQITVWFADEVHRYPDLNFRACSGQTESSFIEIEMACDGRRCDYVVTTFGYEGPHPVTFLYEGVGPARQGTTDFRIISHEAYEGCGQGEPLIWRAAFRLAPGEG